MGRDNDEVDGEETCQGNSWIDDGKCLRDDSEVDESLALGEKWVKEQTVKQ